MEKLNKGLASIAVCGLGAFSMLLLEYKVV